MNLSSCSFYPVNEKLKLSNNALEHSELLEIPDKCKHHSSKGNRG